MKQSRGYMRSEDREVTQKQWLKLATSVLIVITWKKGTQSYLFKRACGVGCIFYEYLDLHFGLKNSKYKYEPLEVEEAIELANRKIEWYKESEEYQRDKDKIETIEVRTFNYKERMEYYKWYKENY